MYESVPSTDIRFLLPGDTLSVYSHRTFAEEFEFTMHYIEKSTGELKSTLAPHQSKLRANLNVSRPSGALISSVQGPYHLITFTAPVVSSRNPFSSFTGSTFRKYGALQAPLTSRSASAKLEKTSALASLSNTVSSSRDSSPLEHPQPSRSSLRSNLSAPSSPGSTSPEPGSSPVSADSILNSFFSPPSSNDLTRTSPVLSTSHQEFIPVGLSFRTKTISNGEEHYAYSPLFLICDSVDQVNMRVCQVFKKAVGETYPFPSAQATNAAEKPQKRERETKASKADKKSKEEKVDGKTEKSSDKQQRSDKSSKTDATGSRKTASGAKSGSSGSSSKGKKHASSERPSLEAPGGEPVAASSSSSSSSSSQNSDSKVQDGSVGTAQGLETNTLRSDKSEAYAIKKADAAPSATSTHRFAALKFW